MPGGPWEEYATKPATELKPWEEYSAQKSATSAPGIPTPAVSPQLPAGSPASPAQSGAGVMEPFRRVGEMVLGTEKQPTALGEFIYPMTATDPTRRRDLNAARAPWDAPPILNFGSLGASAALPNEYRGTRGAVSGVEEFMSGLTSPTNVTLMGGMGLLKAAPMLQKIASAGFSADMLMGAYKQYGIFRERVDAGDMEGAMKALVNLTGSAAMGTAAARHAVVESPRPVRIAPDTPAEAAGTKAALATNADLADARTDPAAAAKVINQEIATRQKAGEWDPSLETTPSPAQRKAAKAAQLVTVPETGDQNEVLTYQRGNLAKELAGKPYEELTPEEKGTVDELAKQGYGMRETNAPTGDTSAAKPETKPIPGETPAGSVPAVAVETAGDASALSGGVVKPADLITAENTPVPQAIESKPDVITAPVAEGPRQDPDTFLVPTKSLNLDPVRFQYKVEGIGRGGVGDELKGVRVWKPERAGVISVWKDPANGKDYVVNGHHRYDLAAGLDVPELRVQYIPAPDAQSARAAGALMNISEGRGTAIDAAKFLRDSGKTIADLEAEGISIKGEKAKDGTALANLAPALFDDVIHGQLKRERAVIIGEGLESYADQRSVLKLAESKKATDGELREMIRLANGGKAAGETRATQVDLFGNAVDDGTSLIYETSQVSNFVRQRLSQEKKLFGLVGSKSAADRLGAAGNKIEAEANRGISDQASQALAVYDKLSERSGPIADLLRESAQRIASGEKADAVKEAVYASVRDSVSKLLGAGKPAESVRALESGAVEGSHGRVQETNGRGDSVDQPDLFQQPKPASATRKRTQRGSLTIGPVDPKAAPADAAPPKKTATAEAGAPPEDASIPVSPSYEKTKGKILDKANVSPETKTALAAEMKTWEAANPERRKITHAEIEANARSIDPSILLDRDTKTAQQMAIKDPALYHAARKAVPGLIEKARALGEQIRTAPRDGDTLELERQRDSTERDIQQLLGITTAVRSQHGRNLAMHKMMVDTVGFDPTYWTGRAKKSLGLPSDASLPIDVQRDITGILAEGKAAEDAALQDIRTEAAGKAKIKPNVAKRKQDRRTVDEAGNPIKPAEAAPETPVDTTTPPTPAEQAAIDADARVQAKRRELARKMAKMEKTSILDAISSIRRAGLLTSPRTHARNLLGNTTMQALEETSRIPGAMLDVGISLFSKQRTVAGPSTTAVARASYAAATKGMQEAAQVMKQGATDEQLAQFDMPRELNLGPGRVSRVLETYVNTVFRSMSAADRAFKRYAIERSLQEQMKLAKVDAPNEAMMAQAIADADWTTFNNKNKLTDMYSRAKSGASAPVRFAMDMAIPFVRTPANVLARVLDYSGGGLGKAGVAGIKAALDTSMTPEQQRYISMNFGRGITGPALIYMGYQLAANGYATGAYQPDTGKRNTDEAAGRLAGAVKLGDTWQMVSPLSPGGALITIGATLQREATGPLRDEAKRPGKVLAVIGRTVLDHPFLQGAKEIADAVSNPAQQGEKALASMAGSFVPSAVSDVASLGDNVRRDARADGGFLDAAGHAIATRTPGLRNTLPERKDVLGRKLPQSKSAVINPGIGSQAKEDSDPIIRELVQNKVALSEPHRSSDETLDQFRLRREVLGREIEKQLGREIATPAYRNLATEEERRGRLDKAEGRARRQIAAKLGKRYKAADPAARTQMLNALLNAGNL